MKKQFWAILVLIPLPFLPACHRSSNKGGGNPAKAQTRVAGVATTNLGAVLDEYVKVVLTPVGGGMPLEFETQSDGTFSSNLVAGNYDLVATRPGYEDYAKFGLAIADGITTNYDFSLMAMPENEYIGSENCGVCHKSKFESFARSGHSFKLNKIENGEVPTYPFTSIAGALQMIADDDMNAADPHAGTDNSLGTPLDYSEVSYVIGGYRWKARFIDANGYIVTGSNVQFNHLTGGMSGYHDNEVDKVYNCGNCHTTGWKHYDANLNANQQGNLPGMDGTFALDGIHCESCHGAGSRHAQTNNLAFITEKATPRKLDDMLAADMGYGKAVACGECHTRDGERDYSSYVSSFDQARIDAGEEPMAMGGRILVKGGLVRHHEQYDEVLGIDPDDPALESTRSEAFMNTHGRCSTCHDPHTSTVFRDISGDRSGLRADCTDCHEDKALTGGMKDLACIDCHMPLMAKSATTTFSPGPGDDRPALGDVASHIFTVDINKDVETEQFTADGKYAYPWVTGKFACARCHSDSGPSFKLDFPFPLKTHR